MVDGGGGGVVEGMIALKHLSVCLCVCVCVCICVCAVMYLCVAVPYATCEACGKGGVGGRGKGRGHISAAHTHPPNPLATHPPAIAGFISSCLSAQAPCTAGWLPGNWDPASSGQSGPDATGVLSLTHKREGPSSPAIQLIFVLLGVFFHFCVIRVKDRGGGGRVLCVCVCVTPINLR